MRHDQVFKELLQNLFREFVELFLPHAAVHLDFDRVRFLDKELFTDLPEGSVREPDLVAEVHTLDGEPELILVHVEVQAQRERDFAYRMFEYYALLRLRYKVPVAPTVLYLVPGAGGLGQARYEEQLFGETILSFEYRVVCLPDLAADDYYQIENPLGPALSALMRPARVGPALQKALSLHRVLRSTQDEARRLLLAYVIETYLKLSPPDEAEYRRVMEQHTLSEVRTMVNIYEARGIEKGLAQGVAQGKRALVLDMMRRRFGEVPEHVATQIEAISSEADIDAVWDRLFTANSIEDLGLTSN